MLRTIFQQWLMRQVTPEMRDRLHATATESLREAVAGAAEANEKIEAAHQARVVDVGLVFALPQEYGCLVDRLSAPRVTRGGGFSYTDGRLGASRIVIVQSGIGSRAATEATKALLQAFRPKRILSAGFSGGLVPALARFDIFVPNHILDRETNERLDLRSVRLPAPESPDTAKTERDDSQASLHHPGRDDGTETLITVSEVIASPAEKKCLAEQFGGVAVDMEGFAVASVCRAAGVPFGSVRVILDPWNESLPPDLTHIADGAKKSTARMLGAIFGTVTQRPSSLLDMYKLKENGLVAAETLAKKLVEMLEHPS